MRDYKSVFDNQTFTVQRYAATYLDANNNLVTPDASTFDITGDMQPDKLRQEQQLEAPQGYTLQDAKYLSTKSDLNTIEDVTATRADTITISGRKFYVWRKMDWSGGPLATDKYKDYTLIMERLPNEGAP